jgi:hypothetical protein
VLQLALRDAVDKYIWRIPAGKLMVHKMDIARKVSRNCLLPAASFFLIYDDMYQ